MTVIVDRPDPSIPVVCRVSAQAEDFQPVGEVNLAGGSERGRGGRTRPISITTIRGAATTAVIRECSDPPELLG